MCVSPPGQSVRVLSFEQIRQLSGPVSVALLTNPNHKLSAKVIEKLQERQRNVQKTGGQVCSDQTCWATRSVVGRGELRTFAAAAGSVIQAGRG